MFTNEGRILLALWFIHSSGVNNWLCPVEIGTGQLITHPTHPWASRNQVILNCPPLFADIKQYDGRRGVARLAWCDSGVLLLSNVANHTLLKTTPDWPECIHASTSEDYIRTRNDPSFRPVFIASTSFDELIKTCCESNWRFAVQWKR